MGEELKLNLILEYLHTHRTKFSSINTIVLLNKVPEIVDEEEALSLSNKLFKDGYVKLISAPLGIAKFIGIAEKGSGFWMNGGYLPLAAFQPITTPISTPMTAAKSIAMKVFIGIIISVISAIIIYYLSLF